MPRRAEIRLLDGPNADLPGPAVRVTLDPRAEPDLDLCALADELARRADAWVGPAVARTLADGRRVVAFPWRRDGTAQALGEAVVDVVAAGPGIPLRQRLDAGADHVRRADPGGPPRLVDPDVPTVAITGTNGKTTTARLLGRMAAEAGLHAAWSSTDGIFVDGRSVESGDWSGPGGARRVLAEPGLGLAILETARGGLMLRGMGVSAVDVAVFTNVSPDHLGLQGLDTVEQLAWAKSTVVKAVRPGGWAVLNAEDPLVRQYHDAGPGRPWFFALDPSGEGARSVAGLSAPLATVRDGRLTVTGWTPGPVDLGDVMDVPVTIGGLAREFVANALAAASAGLAAGLALEAVRAGLRSFAPDPATSPGRMNIWTLPTADGGAATVILDFAHNEAGAAALMRVATGLRAPGGQLHASIGNAGDRTDEGIYDLARIVGRAADTVQLAAKPRFLRGRTQAGIDDLQRAGLAVTGKRPIEETPDEPTGLRALLARARDRDVVAMMVHEDREECEEILRDAGAVVDTAEELRAKVTAARR